MSDVVIPAEQWERLSEHSSVMELEKHRGKRGPVPVNGAEHRGWLYAIFGVIYGSYTLGKKPSIDSWLLVPPEMYAGETTTAYHDEKAIRAGLRERGDHTGLIVSVGGRLMACAQRVRFLCGLPSTTQLSMAEAKAHDEEASASGWRALWFDGKEPEWRSLGGHPVAVYRGHKTLGTNRAVLLWRYDAEAVAELAIGEDVPLDKAPEASPSASQGWYGQMALF